MKFQWYAHKNYTTVVPANRSIAEIQDALVKHGATGMRYKYEQGTGRIEAWQFLLRSKNQDVAFSLPVHWRKFPRVVERQQIRRYDEEAYVYRVVGVNPTLVSLGAIRRKNRQIKELSDDLFHNWRARKLSMRLCWALWSSKVKENWQLD